MNGNTPAIESLELRTLLSTTGLPIGLGNELFDMGSRIVATSDGGYVAAGIFSETVNFNPNGAKVDLTARGDSDIYVAKYSSAGLLQWVKQFGGDTVDKGLNNQKVVDIAADPSRAGDIFYNGFGSDPFAAGEYINDMAVASNGDIVLAGSFIGQVDFNPGAGKKIFSTFDKDFPDAFVVRLHANGGFVWADQFGDRFTDTANAIALDSSGNIFVTGLFSRSVDFVPGDSDFTLTAAGRADGFLLKLNSGGKVQWVDQFGDKGTKAALRDVGDDVAVDAQGNAYVVGTFAGELDFGPNDRTSLDSGKRTAGFLAKFSPSGTVRYANATIGDNYNGLTSVQVDSQGSVYVAGYFENEDFSLGNGLDSPLLNATPKEGDNKPIFTDAFIAKISGGKAAWVQQLAGTGVEFVNDMALDSSGNLVVAGAFYGTNTFGSGPTLSSAPGVENFKDPNDGDRDNSYDAYLWKLSTATGSTAWVQTIGAAGDDFGAGVAITSNDDVLFTGRFKGTVDFDTTSALRRLRGLGAADAFITEFDSSGAPLL